MFTKDTTTDGLEVVRLQASAQEDVSCVLTLFAATQLLSLASRSLDVFE